VCPHAAIRVKAYPQDALHAAPPGFKAISWKGREFPDGTRYTVQVSPRDCTGCTLCVAVCPAKSKDDPSVRALNMVPAEAGLMEAEDRNFAFFLALPEADRTAVNAASVRGSQLLQPLFEFSGACAGCGETPYLKLMTQLFGDRLLVANATGCSSIFGGNLPTTPWTFNGEGRGPAWSNSLFEDNAEFGLGLRLSLDHQRAYAEFLLRRLADTVDKDLAQAILAADQHDEPGIREQRRQVAELKERLRLLKDPDARDLAAVADSLVRKSVWIVGGDGWAYDIGYGGLDFVLRTGANVKVLVLDTEVYSNTGGQASQATPRGAVARFAATGRNRPRKDLGLAALTLGDVYVARVAMGASDVQSVKAFVEAEAYEGPALLIAYAHCIAHGIEMSEGLTQQKLAVQSGYWPLFRYDPSLAAKGQPPLKIDSRPPQIPLEDYIYRELRYRRLAESDPEHAKKLLAAAKADVRRNWTFLQGLANILSPEPAAAERPG